MDRVVHTQYLYISKPKICDLYREIFGTFPTKSGPNLVLSLSLSYMYMPIGYVYTPSGECFPVEEIDLNLWCHGESDGSDPKDFGFRFKANGQWHDVQVRVLDSAEVMMGWQWEARYCTV